MKYKNNFIKTPCKFGSRRVSLCQTEDYYVCDFCHKEIKISKSDIEYGIDEDWIYPHCTCDKAKEYIKLKKKEIDINEKLNNL